MGRDVRAVIRAPSLDKRRARRIERENRRANVLPLHAETALLQREASLAIPAVPRLLADDADANAVVWAMRPDRVEQLAATLEWLYDELPDEFTFELLRAATAPTEKRVSRPELLRIVRSGRVETSTRYRIPAM